MKDYFSNDKNILYSENGCVGTWGVPFCWGCLSEACFCVCNSQGCQRIALI